METGEERESPLLDNVPSSPRASSRATSAQTLGNILVSICGTGMLGLPYAFRVGGWLSGSLCIAVAALLSYYCMLLLVQCRKKLEEDAEEPNEVSVQTYGDIGANAFGLTGRYLTEFLILLSYIGGSVANLLFIGQNLSSLTSFLTTNSSNIPTSSFILLLLLPLEIALSFIRSLSFLAPFSAFATFCNVFAMAVVIKEDLYKLNSKKISYRKAFNGITRIPFTLGVAVFCIDGIGMTLPLERSMSKRRKFPWVLMQAFMGILVAYVCFGAFGYLAFGEETDEIVTLNLQNNWSAFCVKLSLCITIAFTFPMSVHPINEIIETKFKSIQWLHNFSHNSQSKQFWIVSQFARVIVVAALAVLATSTSGFAQLMSFTGSTVCGFISYVLPVSFHLKILGSSLSLWQKLVDCFILLVGLVFALYGTYDSIFGGSSGL